MKINMITWTGGLAAALTIGAVPVVKAGNPKVYVLGGYSLSGFAGINTDELTAKLKDQAGSHVTQADIAADQATFTDELRARHVKGRFFAGTAEKNGKIWMIFDLQAPPVGSALYRGQPMTSQTFIGATLIPASELAAATGLKPGDTLSLETLRAAHDALIALYARTMPGKAPSIRSRAQVSGAGHVVLTWIIVEQ